jgi:hypothetical protein
MSNVIDLETVYARRAVPLSDEEKVIVGELAMIETKLLMRAWSKTVHDRWEIDPNWQMSSFAEYLADNCSTETLRTLFFGVSQYECCDRHMGSAPVAIDSDEVTPANKVYCGCEGHRRAHLRRLKTAFKLKCEV